MPIRSRNYHCATCRIENGESQYLCQTCYSVEDPTHISQHEFVSWDVVIDSSEPVNDSEINRKQVWACSQCPGLSKFECRPCFMLVESSSDRQLGMNDGREHLHQHKHILFTISWAALEAIRIHNASFCPHSKTRTQFVQESDPVPGMSCVFCRSCEIAPVPESCRFLSILTSLLLLDRSHIWQNRVRLSSIKVYLDVLWPLY